MLTTFEIAPYEAMTAQIVHHVFDTMLSYPIAESAESYERRSSVITAAIFLAGTWKGAVLLECSEQQACLFTGLLMGIPQPAHIDDDTRDALAEMVNVIGGNLKSVLPPGVSLSMPSVLEGPDYALKICGLNEKLRLSFRGEAGPLWVTLVQVTEASGDISRSSFRLTKPSTSGN